MSTAPRYVVHQPTEGRSFFLVVRSDEIDNPKPSFCCSFLTRGNAEHVAAALNHLEHMAQLTARVVSIASMHSTSGAEERP